MKKLAKKYQSLARDLSDLEDVLTIFPTGNGNNFAIIHSSTEVKIVKTRLACKSLRDRSIRLIYAYHQNTFTFVYLEIYFKGEKENEDYKRVKDYLKSF